MQGKIRHSGPIGRAFKDSNFSWIRYWTLLKTIAVDNTGNASTLTDFQVEVNLSAANFDFTKVQSDGSDIRFKDSDDSTLLSYYIHSYDSAGQTAKIYVKIPSIIGLSSKNIYIYKLTGGAAVSSGANTFDYFDDFSTYTGVKNYFTQAGLSNFASWNHEPAVYYNGKTYIAYCGFRDDPYIITYTHATGVWSLPVKVGTNPNILDYHEQPAIHIDTSGYIYVFWGAHNSAIKFSKSTASEDISTWTAKTDIDTDATYPQVFQKDTTIYLFYRLGVGTAYGYKTSADGGATWSAYSSVIAQKCYANARLGDDGNIHVAWCNTENTGVNGRHDIHYMYFNGTNWKNIAGTNLTIPYNYDADTIVFNVNDSTGYTIEPQFKIVSGSPYLLFAQVHVSETNNHIWKFAKYVDGAWVIVNLVDTVLTTSFANNFALISNSATSHEAYIMVGTNLEKWITTDGGANWSKSSAIMSDGQVYCCHEVFNGQSNAKVIIGEYLDQTNPYIQAKIYLHGDNGFVTRDITEDLATNVIGSSGRYAYYSWSYKSGYIQCYIPSTKGQVMAYTPQNFALSSNDVIIETDCEMSDVCGMGLITFIQDANHQGFATMIRGSVNDALFVGADIDATYASWVVGATIGTKAFTPSTATRYPMQFKRLTNDEIFNWTSDNVSGISSAYSMGRIGLFVYMHTTVGYKVPNTIKFYYLRVRKNTSVMPVLTLS